MLALTIALYLFTENRLSKNIITIALLYYIIEVPLKSWLALPLVLTPPSEKTSE